MDDPIFDPGEATLTSAGNPTWPSVELWAKHQLKTLREQREKKGSDLRDLDIALGSIAALKELLALPELIRQERNSDPIHEDDFNIPNL